MECPSKRTVLVVGDVGGSLVSTSAFEVERSRDISVTPHDAILVSAALVKEAREAHPSTPLVALVRDEEAQDASLDGADFVLPLETSCLILHATLSAAWRRLGALTRPLDAGLTADPPRPDAPRLDCLANLRRSEEVYRQMMTAATDAILIADFETAHFIDANPAACAMFGYSLEELRQLTGRQLSPPEASATPERLTEALKASGAALEHRHRLWRKDESRFWATVSLTGYDALGRRQYIAIVRDVTTEVEREDELRRSHRSLELAHEQVLRTSRLAALGQMAAGIGHEINNPLQYILGGLDELRALNAGLPSEGARPDNWELREQILNDMVDGATRIQAVTSALAPFAQRDDVMTQEVDLNETVAWATRVTDCEIKRRARLELHLAPDLPQLRGNRAQLEQLVTHLIANAAQAIPRGDIEGNRITITTLLTSDEEVRLIVTDTGVGIAVELRERIFEPFFAARAEGMGTGLGLPLCMGIAERHHASLSFETVTGLGTSFIVTFPARACAATVAERATRALGDFMTRRSPTMQAQPLSTPPRADTTGPTSGIVVGRHSVSPSVGDEPSALPSSPLRVLVIDDEEPLLRLYRRFLRGFDVVTARGGQAAIEQLSSDARFDVIMCDLMMPGVDGQAVHAYVTGAAPHLAGRMIFCSGGAATEQAQEFVRELDTVILTKPVGLKPLREAIETVASAERPSADNNPEAHPRASVL